MGKAGIGQHGTLKGVRDHADIVGIGMGGVEQETTHFNLVVWKFELNVGFAQNGVATAVGVKEFIVIVMTQFLGGV